MCFYPALKSSVIMNKWLQVLITLVYINISVASFIEIRTLNILQHCRGLVLIWGILSVPFWFFRHETWILILIKWVCSHLLFFGIEHAVKLNVQDGLMVQNWNKLTRNVYQNLCIHNYINSKNWGPVQNCSSGTIAYHHGSLREKTCTHLISFCPWPQNGNMWAGLPLSPFFFQKA